MLKLQNMLFFWHKVQNRNKGLKDGSKAVSVHPYFNFLPKIFVILGIRRYSNGDHKIVAGNFQSHQN
jgi:hypothetical protein